MLSLNLLNHNKVQNGMVTKDTLCLATDIFPDEVEKQIFVLLHLGWYLFSVVHGNRYLLRCSNENVLFITITGNIYVTR